MPAGSPGETPHKVPSSRETAMSGRRTRSGTLRSRLDELCTPRSGNHLQLFRSFYLTFGALLLFACSQVCHASLFLYVGKGLTEDGNVMVAGFGDEPSSHWLSIVPRQRYPKGATISVGGTGMALIPGELIDIPQVRETFSYIAMNYSYYRGLPAPLVNGGLNEYGVAVRDVACTSRRELVEMTPKDQRGLNYSDLARIVLQRARTAREALDIAVGLIKRYGDFTYGGNSHLFADPNEGWVLLEFAGGKGLWVAHRLGPNDIWADWRGQHDIGFVQTLPADWHTSPDYLASDNFVSFAVKQGWYTPGANRPFNVMEIYSGPTYGGPATAEELRRVEAAVRAAAPKVDVRLLMQLIHSVGRDSSGYGQVADLRPNTTPPLRTLWVAPGPPLTAAFIPWRLGVDSIPPEYQQHRYLTAGEAERGSIDPTQRGVESTHFADRAVKRLLYLVNEHREFFLPEVTAALDGFEARELASQGEIERTAQILLSAHEDALAHRYLTERANAEAGDGLRLMEALADGIEARTKALYGIRVDQGAGPTH
jgi:dipeptidase